MKNTLASVALDIQWTAAFWFRRGTAQYTSSPVQAEGILTNRLNQKIKCHQHMSICFRNNENLAPGTRAMAVARSYPSKFGLCARSDFEGTQFELLYGNTFNFLS